VIGDDWEQALPSGAAYTARLSLDPNSVSVLPYVVLQAADGTQRQEALDEIWLDSYFQLLYAYDLSCSGGQITVSIGLQTGGDCALSIPEDVKGIWITSASGSDVAMEPDGARIPDAAGMDSEVTVAAPDSSSTAADLYYYYYTAVLDYPEGGSLQLTCVLKTDGQARYTIDLGSVQSQEIGGSGSVYPEWE
jgi:hypothetical protein